MADDYINRRDRPVPPVRFCAGDTEIRILTDITDPIACLGGFMAMYGEMERRHGVAVAQTMVDACRKPDRVANDKRNTE
jgi:hypothetical protein